MLESIPHRSGPFKGNKKSVFEYYQNFEEYPQRYPKYCEWVELADRKENVVTTKEFWNISLDNEIYHALITVRYELIPFTEIRYEIIEGNLARLIGIKNRMKFSDLQDKPDFIVVEIAMPILDITGHPNVSKSSVYQDLGMYLTIQDSICIHNNQDSKFAVGQTCSICNRGKLGALPGEITEKRNHKLTAEIFECGSCRQVFKNYLSVSKDTVEWGSKSQSNTRKLY
jgi:hypothetical protein